MPSLAQLVAHRRADKVPAGWMTRQQLAKAEGYGCSEGSFFYIVRQAIAADPPLLETRKFRVVWGDTVRPVAHYRRTKHARR